MSNETYKSQDESQESKKPNHSKKFKKSKKSIRPKKLNGPRKRTPFDIFGLWDLLLAAFEAFDSFD